MAATLNELANRLQLSKGTISRILNGKGDAFAEGTRERVLDAAREMGYRPSHIARALSTGRTGIITLWLWSEGLQSAYHARVAHAFYEEILPHHYQLLINLIGGEDITGFAADKGLSPWHVDGIIAHESGPAVSELLGRRPGSRIPIVSTGVFNIVRDLDFVAVDFRAGMREMMAHLLAPGRRRIAYLAWDMPRRPGDGRYEVFVDSLAQAGLEPEFIDVAARSRAAARAGVKSYIAENGCPDAVFCHNDELAIGAYRGLLDLGIRVPGDIAIVGCDGIEESEYLETPLTTLVQPLEQMASLAWQYLQRRIEEPDAPLQQTWLLPHLVIRESSRA